VREDLKDAVVDLEDGDIECRRGQTRGCSSRSFLGVEPDRGGRGLNKLDDALHSQACDDARVLVLDRWTSLK
jgi:hypothetical protein